MKKLISVVLVILILMFLLASCAGKSETDKNDTGKDTGPTGAAGTTVLDNSNSTTVIFHDMVIRIPNRFGSKTAASNENNFFF